MAAVPTSETKGLSQPPGSKLCDHHLNLGLFAPRAGALAHTSLPLKIAHRPPGSSNQAFASLHPTSCKARVVNCYQKENRGKQGLTAPKKRLAMPAREGAQRSELAEKRQREAENMSTVSASVLLTSPRKEVSS